MNFQEMYRMPLVEVDKKIFLYSDERIKESTIPDGLYRYDVVSSGGFEDEPFAEIKDHAVVNYYATILGKEPLILDSQNRYFPIEWGFINKEMNYAEYMNANKEDYI